MIRFASGRQGQTSAVVLDGRTLQSSCERGPRSGHDAYKRKRGSKVHMAVDALGHLRVVHMTPANEQKRMQVFELREAVHAVTAHTVELAWADQGCTGQQPRQYAQACGIELQVVKLVEAKKDFVLLPKCWVIECSFARAAWFHQLDKDCERLPKVLRELHFLVFAILLLPKAIALLTATENS